MSFIENERPQVNEVYAKLIEAKKQFGKAIKNAKNPHFKNNYADLQSVLDAVTDALLGNDLVVSQTGERSGDLFVIRTLVFDSNGDSIDFGIMPVKTIKDDAQAFGSGLTYARRYALMSAFGLAPEDDDGQLASIASPVDALRQQVIKLGKECISLGITPSEVQGALKGVEAKNLTEHQAHQGIDSLTKIIEMTKKGKA
jgi:hypothetical protein